MPRFSYDARDAAGKAVTGLIQAEDRREAVEVLRSRGLAIISIELNKDVTYLLEDRRLYGGRVPLRDLAVFCRQFATLLGAGVPVIDGLRTIARSGRGRRLGQLLSRTVKDLDGGEPLSRAFQRQGSDLPPIMVHMAAAGEVGGVLEEVFARLADQFERQDTVVQKVRSALTYPAAVLGMALLIVTFLVAVVVPSFAAMYAQSGTTLPLPTRLLLGLSHFLRTYWYVALVGLAGGLWGLRRSYRGQRGRQLVDRLLLRVPIFGPLLLRQALALFARTLGTLLRGGIPIMTALSVAGQASGNTALAPALEEAQAAVRDGQSIIGPLRRSRLFPEMMLEMMVIGEESGATDALLAKVADYYEREVNATVDRLTSLMEPAIVLVLGVIVGFIVLALVLPMFDSWQLIGK